MLAWLISGKKECFKTNDESFSIVLLMENDVKRVLTGYKEICLNLISSRNGTIYKRTNQVLDETIFNQSPQRIIVSKTILRFCRELY